VSSILDELIGIFSRSNPSSHTMVLQSTKPLTENSIKHLPEVKRRPVPKVDNLTAICEPIFYKMWEPRCLTVL
jgi:hypothetical protein